MNVVIVTQEEPFYLPLYISHLLKDHEKNIAGIIVLPSFPNFSKMITYNFKFWGVLLFTYLGLRYIYYYVYDILLRSIGFGKKNYRIRSIAQKFNIPYIKVKDINCNTSVDILKSLQPDIIFSLAASQKFQKKIIDLPKYGCFNIHSSLLPKYRGVNAIFWAMYYNEEKTGVTIHKINQKIDAGPIIVQKEIIINKNDSFDNVCLKIIKAGAKAFTEFLDIFINNKGLVKYLPNDKDVSKKYYSFPQAEHRKLFLKKGKRFFRYI